MSTKNPEDLGPTLFSLSRKILAKLTQLRRLQLGAVLMLMLASSLAEIFSLGAVLPFLAVLTNPEKIWRIPFVEQVASRLGMSSQEHLLMPVTLLFVFSAICAAVVRLFNVWLYGRLAAAIGTDFSCEAYRRTLYQPYIVHVSRNSSSVITTLQGYVDSLIVVVNSMLALASNSLVLLGLLCALLLIDAKVALASGGVFLLAYAVIIQSSKRQLASNSRLATAYRHLSLQALQEGLGAIRDVLLDGSQQIYLEKYRKADWPLRQIASQSIFLASFPRYIMEAVGLCLIGFVSYLLSRRDGGISTALPILGALALGAQRILPSLQQTYNAWAVILANKYAVQSLMDTMEQPLTLAANLATPPPISWKDKIQFDQVSFYYNNGGKKVLDCLSFSIKCGDRIGIIGTTGSGKSTLLDLLMGLLTPGSGQIAVDGESIHIDQKPERLLAWRAAIANVPQMIYLADSSLAENIAFGVAVQDIDFERIKLAARKAQIAEFIESCPLGYNTFVGERGVRLSGGQRQRVGIARALYKKASVLVFDEATSALDNFTEAALMAAVEGLSRDLTIIIIAHRLTTVEHCDHIIQIEGGEVVWEGSPLELLSRGSA